MRDLEMKEWMGKCKHARHYKVVRLWQVSLERMAGGLFNISMNELEDTPLAKPADDQKIAINIKLGVVIQSDLVPWESKPSKQGMGLQWGRRVQACGRGIRSFPKLQESRRRSSHVVSGKADLSVMLQLGRSALLWVVDWGTTKWEGITAGAPCPLLGSANQEGCWKTGEDSVKSRGNYCTVTLSVCFSVDKTRASKTKTQS